MGHEHVSVRLVGQDSVRVECRWDHLRFLADLAILADRIDGNLVTAIGRAEQPSSGLVGGYVGQAFGERHLGDELQCSRRAVNAVGNRGVGLRTDRGEEEPLVGTHVHRHDEFAGFDGRTGLQRAVVLHRVHADSAILGVGDIDVRRCLHLATPETHGQRNPSNELPISMH